MDSNRRWIAIVAAGTLGLSAEHHALDLPIGLYGEQVRTVLTFARHDHGPEYSHGTQKIQRAMTVQTTSS